MGGPAPSVNLPTSLRIVIDGLYVGKRHGTGISTYARTLSATLAQMGHRICWLSGAEAPNKQDKLVDEVSIADEPVEITGLRRNANTAWRMLQGLATSNTTARCASKTGAVISNSNIGSNLLAPNLYVHAHYRHMLLRQFTEVALPCKADALHLTAPLPIRVRGLRTITTVHDLVPIRLPATTPDNKAEFIARLRTTARLSDLIITVSEASKRDVVDILNVDPDRIAVTYTPSDLEPLGADERGYLERSLARFDLLPDGYLLFVGALEPKKNIRRLIDAFLAVDTSIPLVIVGGKGWMWERELGDLEDILGPASRARLKFLGYVARSDLRFLYAGARAFAFPSLYEGFGVPALDALAAGLPTLVSNAGSLPEVCGKAALYADPWDQNDIRDRIGDLLFDNDLRARLATAGPIQAAQFSSTAYADRLAQAYARLNSLTPT